MLNKRIEAIQKRKDIVHRKDKMIWGEMVLASKMLLWDTEKMPFVPQNWDNYGFKIFSQNNEDGLLQYLIHHTNIHNKVFIEFGVEDYTECNTRFLLMHDNWSGLVMDGSKKRMDELKHDEIYWKHSIEAKGAFITRENINELIESSGISGEIGLLSIDIDGNDYWVLQAIDVVDPQILICEFNSIFGYKEKVTIPYSSDFYRTKAHYSNLYWGGSIAAFTDIANSRGYKLVCINNLGNNAFFVKRNDSDLPEVGLEEACRECMVRESRDESGNLSFLSLGEGRSIIADMSVIDTITGIEKCVKDLVI